MADWGVTLWVTRLGAYPRDIFPSVIPWKRESGRGRELWIPILVGMTKGGGMLESPLFWFSPYYQLLFLGSVH